MCRSRRELSNAYLLAKFGFDTAENEPCKVCPLSAYRSPRYDGWTGKDFAKEFPFGYMKAEYVTDMKGFKRQAAKPAQPAKRGTGTPRFHESYLLVGSAVVASGMCASHLVMLGVNMALKALPGINNFRTIPSPPFSKFQTGKQALKNALLRST